jgi:hypothetical protein
MLPRLFDQGNGLLEVNDLRHEEGPVQLLNVGVSSGNVLVQAAPGPLDVLCEECWHRPRLFIAIEQVSTQRPLPQTYGRNVVPAKETKQLLLSTRRLSKAQMPVGRSTKKK